MVAQRFGRLALGLIWVLALVALLAAAAQPVSLPAQIVLMILLLAAMAVLKGTRAHEDASVRRTMLVMIGGFIVARYLCWRTLSTLPPLDDPFAFVPGLVLYAAEVYAIVMFFVNNFVVIDPVTRMSPPLPEDPAELPTVDVFVPSFNEDDGLIETTLIGAKRMWYPADRLNVYLLDDGSTDMKRMSADPQEALKARERHERLKVMCARLGVHYLTRETNAHAKAGNLNAALPETHGDLIAVFDADHVPTRDFLLATVGFFRKDPKLFLVQTPHFFLSPDPLERNLKTFERMPSENEMFYGMIQRGLDRWNGAFFCGSAALLRRACLEEVGGFSGLSITEDAETALDLHARGYNSVYYGKPLIAGLQPESYAAFIGQRSRWAQGMTQIFMMKNPLIKRGLRLPQRLCYLASSMFWLFPFSRLMFLIAPLFYLFFGLEIYRATAAEFAGYTLTYLVASLMIQNALNGRFRWPLISELYELSQSLHTSVAIVKTMIDPRKPVFRVTAKGETLAHDHVSPLAKPLVGVVGLLILGMGAALWRWWMEPATRDVLLVVTFWNTFNLLLASAALGVVCEHAQHRAAPRVMVKRPARILIDGTLYEGALLDLSQGGARLAIPARQAPKGRLAGRFAELLVDELTAPAHLATGEARPVPVEMRYGRPDDAGNIQIGLRFMPETDAAKEAIVDLVYGSSALWAELLSRRHRRPGVVRGVAHFIRLSAAYGFRSLGFVLGGSRFRANPAPPPPPRLQTEPASAQEGVPPDGNLTPPTGWSGSATAPRTS
ncbi:UDP-forming cellulose synthase catalytic subunit [Tistrella mobilis]|uniref:Cellulose synthase catalytic subunit [UDP-forming] n=1 Tax=Tistrella mobilis (strain KA081020-065) TaxID=1110502 RepID=I3TJI5_TISMK|nr:UDP-forming cellulose synthase catalytic subunit [Tistrella mobilis]AFK52923.1 putative cellulose synthase catalytic subunit [Tistrella mobilis KA081020-065]